MCNLSIIIPHYNSVNTLQKLLDLIPIKNDIQTIVIDDNSNEGVIKYDRLRTGKKYQHITFLENNTNVKGAGVCRNIGIKHAKGEWVLFADADDILMEGF